MTNRLTTLLLGATLLASAQPLAAQHATSATPRYRITHRYPLGGAGGWDYLTVDTAGHRLFITRSDRVTVVDPASGKTLGEIPGLNRGHGVAFSYATGHGFITSGEDSSVVMFDLKTLAVLGRTTAAVDADAVLVDPATGHVFTFNGDANSASVLDAGTGARIASIDLGGKPEFGVSDGRGRLYVNIEDKSEVVELDARAQKVLRRWPLAPCEEPSGLAIDRARGLLFSGCRNKRMAVSSIAAGKVVRQVPIGAGVDANAFDPTASVAFSSNGGDGTLTVVKVASRSHFTVLQNLPTMMGARTMALDPRTHAVYTVSAKFGPAPAAATPSNPRRRPPMVPDTFELLVLERS